MTVELGGLRVVDAVTVGCRGRNEDRVGHCGASAWIMDGATGVAAGEADHAGELQEYLGLVEGALERRLAQADKSLRTLLREVIEEATERFVARFSLAERARYELPSAGLALVRQASEKVEYALLGDCRILAATRSPRGPEVRNLIGSDRLERLDDEVVEEVKRLQGAGVSDFSSLRRAITPRLRENRSLMNTEGGYWVLGLDPRAADRARYGTLPLAEIDALLLVSDGFYRLVDVFGVFSDSELLAAGRSSRLSELADKVRALEEDDVDCVAFPRLKVRDDASALLMTQR